MSEEIQAHSRNPKAFWTFPYPSPNVSFAKNDSVTNTFMTAGQYKVCIWAKWPIRPELILVSVAWRTRSISTPSGCYCRGIPSIKFASTHLFCAPGWREAWDWTWNGWTGNEHENHKASTSRETAEQWTLFSSWFSFYNTRIYTLSVEPHYFELLEKQKMV